MLFVTADCMNFTPIIVLRNNSYENTFNQNWIKQPKSYINSNLLPSKRKPTSGLI